MADPLSITALGITVCQGCVAVLSAWRSFDKDLNSALQAIEGLLGTLMVLKPLIDGSPSPASPEAVNLKDKIRGCEAGVKFLEDLLEKVNGQHLPGNQSRKAWKKIQHLIHPLKKGSLNELKENVSKSHHGLAMALQVYQLAIGSTDSVSTSTKLSGIENRIDDLPRTLRVAETSTLISEIRDSTAAVPRDIENILSQQTANLATTAELARLQEDVQALPETLHIRENSSILSDIRDSTTTIPRMIENVVVQQTASLATSIAITNLQNDVRLLPQSLNATENMAMLSDIHNTVTAIPQNTGDIVMQYLEGRLVEMFDQKINELAICHQTKTLEHMRSCGFTFPPPSLVEEKLNQPISSNQYSTMFRSRMPVYVNHRTSNYGKQHKRSRAKQTDTQPSFHIRFLGAFTRLCITASHGAGGHSIARMLCLRGFVCLDSKAFKVIDDYKIDYSRDDSLRSGKPTPKGAEQWCYVVKTATEEVRRLLATGEASPVSVDNSGETLMHRSIYWVINTVLSKTSSEKSWDLVETCLDLIKTLSDLGVPENEVNSGQISPLSAISWWSEKDNPFASKIQIQLRNMGFDMVGCISKFGLQDYGIYNFWINYPGNPTPVQMLNIMRSNPYILEGK